MLVSASLRRERERESHVLKEEEGKRERKKEKREGTRKNGKKEEGLRSILISICFCKFLGVF